MADENRPIKYMRYAIGEIALVVIGILIALQINNWNEERKEKVKEIKILTSLSEDFKINLSELQTAKKEITDIMQKYATVLVYAGNIENGVTHQMMDTIASTGFVTIELVEGSLNSLLNSEKLELIKNDSLKRILTSYPAYLRRYRERETQIMEYVRNKQRTIVRSYISLSLFLYDDKFNKFKKEADTSDYIGLLKNRKYQNIIIGVRLANGNLLTISEQLERKTLEAIKIIERELSN